MAIPKHVVQFREKRASELDQWAKLLKRHIGDGVDSPIYAAVKQLRDHSYIPQLKNGSRDVNYWGYEISGFTIPVDTTKHVRPKVVRGLELTLDMKVVADSREWEALSDPFLELYFKVVIRGVTGSSTHFTGFHIDRHDNNSHSTELHPVYHLQYIVNPYDSEEFQYGSVLNLDIPRIMHYPMEFILGSGYLISNFFPFAMESLLDDGVFISLYKKYQARIWKPYVHSLAFHWDPFDRNSIVWKPTTVLCPYLV